MSEAPEPQRPDPEDEARAQWYAVISRLFRAPPDATLLRDLAAAPAGEGAETATPFLDAWHRLQAACADADPEAVRAEFDELFVGVGKAPVTPYTSAYAASHAPDRHLLALRECLGGWGLTRRDQVFETEDHIAAVCETMRWLIEHGHPLDEQRDFFQTFIDPALPAFCSAIKSSPLAAFYKAVGAFARAFHEIEKDAFDMHVER